MNPWPWTGLGCDLCGFGSVENVDEFDPKKPCPDCGTVALPERVPCSTSATNGDPDAKR